MNKHESLRVRVLQGGGIAAAIAFAAMAMPVSAALTKLSDSPLNATIKASPNVVFTVDDSSSMLSDFLPDLVVIGTTSTYCRGPAGIMNAACGSVGGSKQPAYIYSGNAIPWGITANVSYASGNPPNAFNYTASAIPNTYQFWPAPAHASDFNLQYYNPRLTYQPPINGDAARTPFPTWNSAAGTIKSWKDVLTDPWYAAMGNTKTTVNMQTAVTVGVWCNSDWPLDITTPASGIAVTGAGDVAGSGADCRMNGTVYDASLRTGASKANGDYQYPFGSTVGADNFFRSNVRTMWCDKTLGKLPYAWPQSCVGNGTWACTLGGMVIWPATQPQSCVFTTFKTGACVPTYTPAGCNTDPTYDLGGCTGSECKVCTNNGCVNPKTGQNGACHLTSTGTGGSGTASCNCLGPNGVCTLACTTGAPNCVAASQTCVDYQPPPTGCTVGVLTQNQTCTQVGAPACSAVLWDTAANVPSGTPPSVLPALTMYNDSGKTPIPVAGTGNGYVCRHNNMVYPTAPGTTVAINNFPTGVFTTSVGATGCQAAVSTDTIPRHYWKTSVEWCTAKIATAGDKWQGFGKPGTCQDIHDATHIYPRFYKFGVDKTDPAYLDNYAYANPAFERVTFDFTKIGSAPVWITHTWVENGTTRTAARTFDQEMENYANWFVYYRTRINALKSSASLAFQSANLDDFFRIAMQTLSNGQPQSQFLNIGLFDTTTGAQRQAFYDTLFKINIRLGIDTPNLDAIVRVGDWFVNGSSGTLAGATDPLDDPKVTCQKNFHMLFTDGITNQAVAPTSIGDFDNIVGNPGPLLPVAISVTPPIVNGSPWPPFYEQGAVQSDTAADYTTKYWITDMRPGWTDNVPNDLSGARGSDPASWQHVNFAALALGTEGTLPAASPTATEIQIEAGTLTWPKVVGPPACVGVACVPNTKQPNPTGVDDLWHAAVNGRGAFVNASNAKELRNGFENILTSISQVGGARTGAANPNPNFSSTNDFIYRVKFEKGWAGSVQKIQIDPATAIPLPSPPNPIWEAANQLDAAMALPGTPWYTSRNIVTMDDNAVPFKNAVAFRAPVTPPPPNTHITAAQYNTLGGDDPTRTAVLEYIRGSTANEGIGVNSFRQRPSPLGDIVNSQASVVGPPMAPYLDIWDPGYSAFVAAYAARSTRIYVGANDGMLHAFKDTTGDEAWAYIPHDFTTRGPIATDGLAGLSVQPLFAHHMYVDGPTKAGDIAFGLTGLTTWHTLLVGGLGKGGKSYYALDITDPDAVKDEDTARAAVLWEFRDDSAGANKHDIGYTYGKPVFGKLRAYGWVVIVSAGYNNASGVGKLYILDPSNGNLLETLTTGSGIPGSPSGLVQFAGYTQDLRNQIIEQIYAGDLNGDVWRWDVSSATASDWNATPATKIAHLTDSGGFAQPVTTAPQIEIDISTGVDRFVFIGTGQLLDDSDLLTTQTQTMYSIRDGSNLAPSVIASPLLRDVNMQPIAATNTAGLPTQPQYGWYQDLTDEPGSRIVVPPEADIGLVAFVATIPSNDVCIIGSPARVFVRTFATGESKLNDPGGGPGIVPSWYIAEGGAGVFFGALEKAGSTPGTYIPDLRLMVTTAKDGQVFTYKVQPPNLVAAHRMSWRQLGQ